MMPKTRFVVVREAIQVLLRHLDFLPPSESTATLHARVEDCFRETEQWVTSPPSDRDQDGLMKRVLAIHIDVTKLERNASATKCSLSCGASDAG